MKPVNLVVVLVWMVSSLNEVTAGNIRRRRDLLDLADMFELLTGLDPTDYIPYGNWCGYGGQGKPLDLIDECCQIHDRCYGVSEEDCSYEQIHIVPYTWKIHNETISCDDANICAARVCTCDKEVVQCIAMHNHTYSAEYRFIKKYS